MTRDETIALYLKGREAWNAWAEKMLAEQKAMEADGRWNENWREWTEQALVDFSHCLFLIKGAEGIKEAAVEAKEVNAGAEPPVKSISLEADRIDFKEFVFPGPANLASAIFTGAPNFWSATFTGAANFQQVTFPGHTSFQHATFTGPANFRITSFGDYANFRSVAFSRDTEFLNATFTDDADFKSATFAESAVFANSTFTGRAYFQSATFSRGANFQRTTFAAGANFEGATFTDSADFRDATMGFAAFRSATFMKAPSFVETKFLGGADFSGARVERAFDMTGAQFEIVPAFNQSDFKQPPDLDNVTFPLPRFWRGGKAELIAQYRAIRRMALLGADYEREQMAFKGEIRSKRWSQHKLYHAGFWYGILYDALSDFGRSTWRPLGAWLACIAIFAVYFLGQSPQMVTKRKEMHLSGPLGQISSFSTVAFETAKSPSTAFCFPGTKPAPGKTSQVPDGFSGLVEEARATTNLVNEALSIAYHNAVIILDSSGDSAHRAFGCLYGVERYGGNPVAFVPRSVAIASGIQKLFSAIFIFLFILAVRNMLRVK
jgi:uncharacterized protein YjbI with pentapeptide repeats